MNWMRIALWAGALAALVAASAWLRSHLVAEGFDLGAASVQRKWDAQQRVDLQARLDLQLARNREQLLIFKNAERNNDEQARLEALRLDRDRAAARVLAGLHATVAALNGRELPSTCDAACIGAFAREAATARELLGKSAARYRDMATAADELRDQVTGLQADAQSVCRATFPTTTPTSDEN